jgi:hypothetical protein
MLLAIYPKPLFIVAFALSMGLLVVPALAQDDAPEAPLDLDSFPADLIDQVVIPVPGEIFAILEKLGETSWAGEMRPASRPSLRGRTDYALALGVAVADGFVAVQAQDKAGVETAGKAVLTRAKALGLGDAVTRHCQAIFDALKADDWKSVREELDKTETTARATMEKMGDAPLAASVSLGGWVRGTEVAAGVISRSFTTDKSELLNQPDLVAHFAKSVGGMADVAKSKKLSAVAEALTAIGKRMGDGEKSVPSDAVVEINERCAALVDLILGLPAKGEGRG